MISEIAANFPADWPFWTKTTRPTSTNLQLEALTIESVDISRNILHGFFALETSNQY